MSVVTPASYRQCRRLVKVIVLVLFAGLCRVGEGVELPEMRPALIGNGPRSLINMIDGQWLVRKGQGNAAVMFNCVVMPNGGCFVAYTYRWTPGGEKLEQRVRRKLAEAQYIPAVYNHKTVTAALYGTVIFSVIEGKRRLRVFLNQEKSELAKESDFIAPQPVGVDEPGAPHKHPLEYPSKARYAHVSGVAVMKLSVDATGKLKDVSVESESPAGFGFGDVTLQAFREDVFLPAYRDGKPVDATTTLAVYFKD